MEAIRNNKKENREHKPGSKPSSAKIRKRRGEVKRDGKVKSV